jgi:GNAT superfamily N-acetyltransferase
VIAYQLGNDLELDQVIDLYRATSLGERRPLADRERMAAMLRNANLVVTAWDGQLLVGISRTVTDFSYVAYLSDLAVRLSHQRHGIGRELIRQTPSCRWSEDQGGPCGGPGGSGLLPAHWFYEASQRMGPQARRDCPLVS